jgi:cytochrome c
MKRNSWSWVFLTAAVLFLPAGCRNEAPHVESVQAAAAKAPAEFSKGESLFNDKCAPCHGVQASGTMKGPPLVHKIYEPSHHGDAAFHMAVQRGVRAHHWEFGNMPPIPGVSEEEVSEIVKYVRWLQREAGIH